MAKVFRIENDSEDDSKGIVGFDCPGCGEMHAVPTLGKRAWKFDGDLDAPTITPSLLVRGIDPLTDEEHAVVMAGGTVNKRDRVCHSYITRGSIEFLSDCTHALAGKTVPLNEVDDG